MRVLVTGSSGHLGEALVRVLGAEGHEVVGLDTLGSPWTEAVASIADRALVRRSVRDVEAVLHAATLHKPHVGTHDRQDSVDTNVTGTLNLLEEAVAAGVGRLVFTSTKSAFGRALIPPPGAPAAWITEVVASLPRNVYGVTKTAAEDLCELVHRDHGLPCLILRTSRFFPEGDDRDELIFWPWNGRRRSASDATSSAPRPPSTPRTWPGCAATPGLWWSDGFPTTSTPTPAAAGGCSGASSASM